MDVFRVKLAVLAALSLAAMSAIGCSQKNPCSDLVTTCDACTDAINHDHCTNIAEDIYYLVHGQPWHKIRPKGEEGIFLPPGFGPKPPGKKESAGQK